MNPLNMRVASNIFMQKTNDHHLKSQYMHYKNGTSLPPTFTTTTLCLLVIDPSFFVLFVKGFLSLISLSLSQTKKKKQREKREKTEREKWLFQGLHSAWSPSLLSFSPLFCKWLRHNLPLLLLHPQVTVYMFSFSFSLLFSVCFPGKTFTWLCLHSVLLILGLKTENCMMFSFLIMFFLLLFINKKTICYMLYVIFVFHI